MTIYLELGDYCEIAAKLLGTNTEQIARLPRIALADSALATPQSGFGGEDAYPVLIEKAAVLVEHLARNHPLPDGNKRAAFLSVWLFLEVNGRPFAAKTSTPTYRWWSGSLLERRRPTKPPAGWRGAPLRLAD